MNRTPLGLVDTYEPLDEASIARIFDHYSDTGFAILTSWRPDTTSDPDSPDTNPKTNKPMTRADNKARLKEMKKALVKKGFGFVPIKGVWQGSSEPSLFVPAKRKGSTKPEADKQFLRKAVVALGKHYNQDAVVWSPGEKVQLVATAPDGREGAVGSVIMRWNDFSPTAIGIAYSRIKAKRAAKKPHQLGKADRSFKFVDRPAVAAGAGGRRRPVATRAIASSVEFQGYFFEKPPRSFVEALKREAEGEVAFVEGVLGTGRKHRFKAVSVEKTEPVPLAFKKLARESGIWAEMVDTSTHGGKVSIYFKTSEAIDKALLSKIVRGAGFISLRVDGMGRLVLTMKAKA
jgi:hypothetical protein